MFWTEKYRPAQFGDIIGQEPVVRLLTSFAASDTVPHLMLTGPHGTGKSAAIECFARQLYGEEWETNTSVFPTADLFQTGKKMLEEDDRFSNLYQKSQSLIVNFKYILKWYASMRPLNAPFKMMVFEDAHALSRDAQQGLRRIMERYSGTCRFLFSTTNQNAIIPAITSRCFPLFFTPLATDSMVSHLRQIGEKEAAEAYPCTNDDIELIAQASRGDLRKAILLLQVAMQSGQCTNVTGISESETVTITASALDAIRRGEYRTAIRELESLMINQGLSAGEVLSAIRSVAHREYNHPLLAIALADTDYRVTHCNNEYVHIGRFATDISDVFI